jgi:hypothetical protein
MPKQSHISFTLLHCFESTNENEKEEHNCLTTHHVICLITVKMSCCFGSKSSHLIFQKSSVVPLLNLLNVLWSSCDRFLFHISDDSGIPSSDSRPLTPPLFSYLTIWRWKKKKKTIQDDPLLSCDFLCDLHILCFSDRSESCDIATVSPVQLVFFGVRCSRSAASKTLSFLLFNTSDFETISYFRLDQTPPILCRHFISSFLFYEQIMNEQESDYQIKDQNHFSNLVSSWLSIFWCSSLLHYVPVSVSSSCLVCVSLAISKKQRNDRLAISESSFGVKYQILLLLIINLGFFFLQ